MNGVKHHPLIVFFILAFAFPWFIWGTSIAQSNGIIAFHIPRSLAYWVGLTIAAYATAAYTGGLPAVFDLLSRLVRWRVAPIWYAVALALTGVLSLFAIMIFLILGGTHQLGVLLPAGKLLPSFLFQVIFFLITEETAWRGFALPRLQARYSALSASLILGVLWGVWHLPLVFIPGSFQSTVNFFGFVLSAVAMAILMTWVFNHSRGSVFVAAIFHASTDTAIAYTGVMSGDSTLFWLFIGVQWTFTAVIVLNQGKRYLARETDLSAITYPQIST